MFNSIRKKIAILIFIIISVTAFIYIYLRVNTIYTSTIAYPLSNKIIIIDPGHGGVDPGKVGLYGKNEKDLNLEISFKIRKILESTGAEVIITRETEDGLYSDDANTLQWIKSQDMKKRREIIQNSGGDIMISIHMNSFPDQRCFGAQTFYLKNDEGSKKVGELIQQELVEVSFKPNHRKAKANDNYYILKKNNMPSVVVECGFLSNAYEEKMLNDDKYQQKISWAIVKGIVRYFFE